MTDILITVILSVGYMILGAGSAHCFPPPLSKDDETKLFLKFREQGDSEARALLIEHNLRLVSHIVRKYYSTQKCHDDLISIGSIGLIKAVDSFNPQSGTKFATYAARCIQKPIRS
jgi:RNA polymerase sporulation-specific sigma factor